MNEGYWARGMGLSPVPSLCFDGMLPARIAAGGGDPKPLLAMLGALTARGMPPRVFL